MTLSRFFRDSNCSRSMLSQEMVASDFFSARPAANVAYMGHSRRFDDVRATSALPLIAGVRWEDRQVRKVHTSGSGRARSIIGVGRVSLFCEALLHVHCPPEIQSEWHGKQTEFLAREPATHALSLERDEVGEFQRLMRKNAESRSLSPRHLNDVDLDCRKIGREILDVLV